MQQQFVGTNELTVCYAITDCAKLGVAKKK